MSSLGTDPIERASKLRQEADLILLGAKLNDILSAYGRVVLTASHFLDLMIYPDIDIYSPPGIHGWIECPTVHRPE